MATKKTKGEQTREKLIAVAADLFHRRGYHAVGLNEICAAGELPKGSVYYHFPKGKEEIAVAVIDASKEQIANDIREAVSGAKSDGEFVELMVGRFAQNLVQSDFTKGCPITTINLEMSGESPVIREACAAAFDYWISLFAGHMEAQGVAAGDAKMRAEMALSLIEGAMIVARARRSTDVLDIAANQIKALV